MASRGQKPLVIEITEQQLLTDVKEAKRILQPFLDFGLRLAVDDFGSGYSSLHYLAELPIVFLKIEGRLVQRVKHDRKVRAIIQGMDSRDRYQIINARVPLAEMYKYSTSLRSITQGRASFKSRFAEYAAVPFDLQQKLMKEAREEVES